MALAVYWSLIKHANEPITILVKIVQIISLANETTAFNQRLDLSKAFRSFE